MPYSRKPSNLPTERGDNLEAVLVEIGATLSDLAAAIETMNANNAPVVPMPPSSPLDEVASAGHAARRLAVLRAQAARADSMGDRDEAKLLTHEIVFAERLHHELEAIEKVEREGRGVAVPSSHLSPDRP